MKYRQNKFLTGIFVVIFTITSAQSDGQVISALLFGEKLNSGNLEFGLTIGPSLTKISNYSSAEK